MRRLYREYKNMCTPGKSKRQGPCMGAYSDTVLRKFLRSSVVKPRTRIGDCAWSDVFQPNFHPGKRNPCSMYSCTYYLFLVASCSEIRPRSCTYYTSYLAPWLVYIYVHRHTVFNHTVTITIKRNHRHTKHTVCVYTHVHKFTSQEWVTRYDTTVETKL